MIRLSPDGLHYLRAAMGLPVPSPYHRRWLLPWALGPDPRRWRALTIVSLVATPFAAAAFFSSRGLTGARLLFATALMCVLPAIRLPARLPVLTDAPAFTLTLIVAATAHSPASIAAALVLGAMRESGPVFAALWAWHPLPLVGLVAAGWFRARGPYPDSEPWLERPFAHALTLRRNVGLDASLYLRPWGAALAGLIAPSWQCVATIAVAHAQLFVAVDTTRLASWAAPVLVLGAAHTIPPSMWPLAIIITAIHHENRA